jgi:peroxiredoxin
MEEVPLIQTLVAKYTAGAVVLGISIDTSLDKVDQKVKEKGMTWPILADPKGFDGPIPTAYHIQGTPTIFVIDRAGKIFATLGSAKTLDTTIQQAIATPQP